MASAGSVRPVVGSMVSIAFRQLLMYLVGFDFDLEIKMEVDWDAICS